MLLKAKIILLSAIITVKVCFFFACSPNIEIISNSHSLAAFQLFMTLDFQTLFCQLNELQQVAARQMFHAEQGSHLDKIKSMQRRKLAPPLVSQKRLI